MPLPRDIETRITQQGNPSISPETTPIASPPPEPVAGDALYNTTTNRFEIPPDYAAAKQSGKYEQPAKTSDGVIGSIPFNAPDSDIAGLTNPTDAEVMQHQETKDIEAHPILGRLAESAHGVEAFTDALVGNITGRKLWSDIGAAPMNEQKEVLAEHPNYALAGGLLGGGVQGGLVAASGGLTGLAAAGAAGAVGGVTNYFNEADLGNVPKNAESTVASAGVGGLLGIGSGLAIEGAGGIFKGLTKAASGATDSLEQAYANKVAARFPEVPIETTDLSGEIPVTSNIMEPLKPGLVKAAIKEDLINLQNEKPRTWDDFRSAAQKDLIQQKITDPETFNKGLTEHVSNEESVPHYAEKAKAEAELVARARAGETVEGSSYPPKQAGFGAKMPEDIMTQEELSAAHPGRPVSKNPAEGIPGATPVPNDPLKAITTAKGYIIDVDRRTPGKTIIKAFPPGGSPNRPLTDVVGTVYFDDPKNGQMTPDSLWVNEPDRHKGIATAMYTYGENVTGNTIVPGGIQSTDAEGVWAKNAKTRMFGVDRPGTDAERLWKTHMPDQANWNDATQRVASRLSTNLQKEEAAYIAHNAALNGSKMMEEQSPNMNQLSGAVNPAYMTPEPANPSGMLTAGLLGPEAYWLYQTMTKGELSGTGAAESAAAAMAARWLGRKAISAVSGSPLKYISRWNALLNYSGQMANFITKNVSSLMAPLAGAVGGNKDTQKTTTEILDTFKNDEKQIKQLPSDPGTLLETIHQNLNPLMEQIPLHAGQMSALAVRAAGVLQQALPKNPHPSPLAQANDDWTPNPQELYNFNQVKMGVLEPKEVFKAAASGRLSQQTWEAFSTVYPELAKDYNQQIMKYVFKNGTKNLTNNQARVFKMTGGVQTPTNTPAQIAFQQGVFANKPALGPQDMTKPKASGLNKLSFNEEVATPNQQINSRKG